MTVADPRPAKRIIDKYALPASMVPYQQNECPLCRRPLDGDESKHHLIPRSQGGSDVPLNLVWVCGDGTRGCHGVLETRGRGTHGLSYEQISEQLVHYVRVVAPAYGEYMDREKFAGYPESRYLGAAP